MLDLFLSRVMKILGLKNIISISQVVKHVRTRGRADQVAMLSMTIKDANNLQAAVNNREKAILVHAPAIFLIFKCFQILDSGDSMIFVNFLLVEVWLSIDVGAVAFEADEFKTSLIEKFLGVTVVEMVVQILPLQ